MDTSTITHTHPTLRAATAAAALLATLAAATAAGAAPVTVERFKEVGSADVNGDRLPDRLVQQERSGGSVWHVKLATRAGVSIRQQWAELTTPDVQTVGFADVNGDRRADLILQYDQDGVRRWQVHLSTGTRFQAGGDWAEAPSTDLTVVGFADADGDGLNDLFLQYDRGGVRRWQVRTSTGRGFEDSGDWVDVELGAYDVAALRLRDVNGDRRADLVLRYDDRHGRSHQRTLLSTGSRFVAPGLLR